MDPNVRAEQRGLPREAGQADNDGTSYLRRLKAQTEQTLGLRKEAAAVPPVPAPEERRQSRRYPCAGSVELRIEGEGLRMWGTLKDISLHGCYVEMPTTFPVDTRLRLALEASGVRVMAEATVRTSYPGLGMGMRFAELAATQESRLREILAFAAKKRALLTPQWRSG